MRHIMLSAAFCTLVASALPVQADPFSATLSGFEEIGALNNATGAILTDGEGSLRLNLDERNQTLDLKRDTGSHPFRQNTCGRRGFRVLVQ